MKVGSPKPAEDGFGSVGAMSQDVERQILHLGHFLGDMGWWGGYRQQTGAEPALEVPSVSQEYGMEGTDSTSFDPVNCTADTGDDLVRGGDPACFRDAIDPAAAGGDAVEEEQVLMEGLEGQGMNEVISGVTDEEWIRTNPQMQRRTPRIDPLTQSDIGERKMVAGLKLVETSKFSNELPSTAWAPEIRRAAHVDDGASFARFRGKRIDLDVNAPGLPFSPTCDRVRGAGIGSSSFYGSRGSSCAVGGSSVQDLDAFGHFAEAQRKVITASGGHHQESWTEVAGETTNTVDQELRGESQEKSNLDSGTQSIFPQSPSLHSFGSMTGTDDAWMPRSHALRKIIGEIGIELPAVPASASHGNSTICADGEEVDGRVDSSGVDRRPSASSQSSSTRIVLF